jgi:uncharacterized membrane protein YfcA
MDLLHSLLAVLCGGLVGFILGLIGGGGSIMATPLLLYVVGLRPHVAIGTRSPSRSMLSPISAVMRERAMSAGAAPSSSP